MLPPARDGIKGIEPLSLKEPDVKKIRKALAAALFLFVLGGAQACVESPTAPNDDDTTNRTCTWIKGILHCIDT